MKKMMWNQSSPLMMNLIIAHSLLFKLLNMMNKRDSDWNPEEYQFYLGKYDKPTEVIAFIDTGAATTIMNPEILPAKWWKPHTMIFSTTSNSKFVTHLISKPITIQFFPGCSVRTTVLGSQLPGKDLVVGFDIYAQAKFLRIVPWCLFFRW
ncbi:hypothetical protein V6N11_038466 [Hibiscus sabdariffa]|uniref:Peptidase A2 domain-containing protein n=1 Tax=Hibiscus sabdariffa TaxID=183260 RepID=A0ABR2SK22_9ROSI